MMQRPQRDPKTRAQHAAGKHAPRPRADQKIALVCDWLTTPGGAEKVLLQLHRMYPNAPIYTSQYRPKKIDWFRDAEVRAGWMNLFPVCLRRFIGLFRQIYFSHLDLSDYDVVISVTGAEAKSVRTVAKSKALSPHYSTHGAKSQEKKAFHLCYCHVPTQYYWRLYDKYLKEPGFGILNPIVRAGLWILVRPLRRADYRAAQRPDRFVTISRYAAEEIKTYYGREAEVIYPPVDCAQFTPRQLKEHRSGFIISCRQVTWKRVDLAIQACLATRQPLTVVGDGPEHRHLVRLARQGEESIGESNHRSAGPHRNAELIKFVPWVETAALARQLQSATAYLFPSVEPFGIAPVEALAAGCPVIAYADGGSRDIVRPGKNGLLFSEQTVESLAQAMQEFDPKDFETSAVIQSAQRFTPEKFTTVIEKIVKKQEARQ